MSEGLNQEEMELLSKLVIEWHTKSVEEQDQDFELILALNRKKAPSLCDVGGIFENSHIKEIIKVQFRKFMNDPKAPPPTPKEIFMSLLASLPAIIAEKKQNSK